MLDNGYGGVIAEIVEFLESGIWQDVSVDPPDERRVRKYLRQRGIVVGSTGATIKLEIGDFNTDTRKMAGDDGRARKEVSMSEHIRVKEELEKVTRNKE